MIYNFGMSAPGMSAAILEKLITADPEVSVETARYFTGVCLSQIDLDRIKDLSKKANEGELTSDESEELRLFALLSDFLTMMHLRAQDPIPVVSR